MPLGVKSKPNHVRLKERKSFSLLKGRLRIDSIAAYLPKEKVSHGVGLFSFVGKDIARCSGWNLDNFC